MRQSDLPIEIRAKIAAFLAWSDFTALMCTQKEGERNYYTAVYFGITIEHVEKLNQLLSSSLEEIKNALIRRQITLAQAKRAEIKNFLSQFFMGEMIDALDDAHIFSIKSPQEIHALITVIETSNHKCTLQQLLDLSEETRAVIVDHPQFAFLLSNDRPIPLEFLASLDCEKLGLISDYSIAATRLNAAGVFYKIIELDNPSLKCVLQKSVPFMELIELFNPPTEAQFRFIIRDSLAEDAQLIEWAQSTRNFHIEKFRNCHTEEEFTQYLSTLRTLRISTNTPVPIFDPTQTVIDQLGSLCDIEPHDPRMQTFIREYRVHSHTAGSCRILDFIQYVRVKLSIFLSVELSLIWNLLQNTHYQVLEALPASQWQNLFALSEPHRSLLLANGGRACKLIKIVKLDLLAGLEPDQLQMMVEHVSAVTYLLGEKTASFEKLAELSVADLTELLKHKDLSVLESPAPRLGR